MECCHLDSVLGTAAEISVGRLRTGCDGDVSGLTAVGSPAVSGRRKDSPVLFPSSETRWLTYEAGLEVAERPGVPQEVEEARDGRPSGWRLTGWRRKASCPEFPSWREPGWALHSPGLPSQSWTSGSSWEAPRVRPLLAGQPWGNCSLYPLISSVTEMIQSSRFTPRNVISSLTETHLPHVTGPAGVFVVHFITGTAKVLKYHG